MSLSQDAGIDFALTVRLYPDAPCRGTRSCTTCIVMCKPIKDLFFNALPGTGKTGCKDKKFTATLPNFQGSFFSGPRPEKGENRSNIAASVPESGCKSTRLRETGKTNGGLFLKVFSSARRKRLQYSELKKRKGRRKGRGGGREDTLLYNIRGKRTRAGGPRDKRTGTAGPGTGNGHTSHATGADLSHREGKPDPDGGRT